MTRIKICGLQRQEDAELAEALGADSLGFVFEPTSPRYVGSPDWGPDWVASRTCEVVAVYGPVRAASLPAVFSTIQGVEWADVAGVDGRRLWAVHRIGPGLEANWEDRSSWAERIVLDAFHPSEYGGSGCTIDWALAAEIVAVSAKPVVLAGGLTPENVARAIREVRPFGVDVSSGVESAPGIKDPLKLRAFVDAVRSA